MSFLYVKVYYGTSSKFDSYIHKPQYLYGFRDCLQKMGYRVDLVPVNAVNYCVMEMCGHQVFCCNLCNLKFNTSYNRDKVCQKAIAAVMEASVKFRTARSVLWADHLLDNQMFKRSKYGPKDYWLPKYKQAVKTFASFSDCLKCCDIEATENSEENPNLNLNIF